MNTYLIYDPAINGAYTQLILQQQYPVHRSLFAGTKDEGLDDVAPFLFQTDELFAQKVMYQQLIELKAVVFLKAEGSLEAVATHFRPFIYQTLKGREYFFRFWDARVLAKFLPTCDKEQIKTFFEDLESLTIADESNAAQDICYRHDHGRLLISSVPSATVSGAQPVAVQVDKTGPGKSEDTGSTEAKKRRTFLS